MLLGTLPIAVDDTFPACLAICTKLSSQDSSNYKSPNSFKWTPNCNRLHTPILSDEPLPHELLWHPEVPAVSVTKYTLSQRRSTFHVSFHVLAKTAPNNIPTSLPSILPCTFSSTLPWMPSMTHRVALKNTHSAWLSVCIRVSSQNVLNYSPKNPLINPGIAPDDSLQTLLCKYSNVSTEHTISYTPKHGLMCTLNWTQWHNPCLLDWKFPSQHTTYFHE
jgi:hypothetical protein